MPPVEPEPSKAIDIESVEATSKNINIKFTDSVDILDYTPSSSRDVTISGSSLPSKLMFSSQFSGDGKTWYLTCMNHTFAPGDYKIKIRILKDGKYDYLESGFTVK